MNSPYRLGRYWIRVGDWESCKLAIVSEVYEHELVLTDIRRVPDGEVMFLRMIVGRANVREATEVIEAVKVDLQNPR